MKRKKKSGESRIKSVLSRIKVLASDGVDFSFYDPWDGCLNEKEIALLQNEEELDLLEIKIDEKEKGKLRA